MRSCSLPAPHVFGRALPAASKMPSVQGIALGIPVLGLRHRFRRNERATALLLPVRQAVHLGRPITPRAPSTMAHCGGCSGRRRSAGAGGPRMACWPCGLLEGRRRSETWGRERRRRDSRPGRLGDESAPDAGTGRYDRARRALYDVPVLDRTGLRSLPIRCARRDLRSLRFRQGNGANRTDSPCPVVSTTPTTSMATQQMKQRRDTIGKIRSGSESTILNSTTTGVAHTVAACFPAITRAPTRRRAARLAFTDRMTCAVAWEARRAVQNVGGVRPSCDT